MDWVWTAHEILSSRNFMKFHFWIWLNDICLDKPANRKKNVQNNQALNISSLQNSFSNSFNSSSGKFQWLIIHESYKVINSENDKILINWFFKLENGYFREGPWKYDFFFFEIDLQIPKLTLCVRFTSLNWPF